MPGFDFTIGADTSAFEQAMETQIPNAAKRAASKTANAVGAALKAGLAGVAAAATAAGGLGVSVIKAASEFETLNMRLVTLMGSTSGAKARMAELSEFAARTPFSLAGLTEADATLRGFGADAEAALPKVADLAGALGLDLVEASSAVGRAWAGGAGAADVLRERGVLAAMEMRTGIKATEMSLGDFRKELLVTLEDFEGGAEALSMTLPGMISTLRDEWSQFAREVADAGIYDAAKQSLVEIQGLLNDNRETIGDVARATGVWLKGGLMFVVQTIGDAVVAWDEMKVAVYSIEGITYGLIAATQSWVAELKRGIANTALGIGRTKELRLEAAALDAKAAANREKMNATRGEVDAIQREIGKIEKETEAIVSRIENADFGGAGVEKAQAEQADPADDPAVKNAEAVTEELIDWEQRRQDALTQLTEQGAKERRRIEEEEARRREAIARQSANMVLSAVQDGTRMRVEEDASMGEILRQQSLDLFGDLLLQLAGFLAAKGTANLIALNPVGAAQLAGAAAAASAGTAIKSGALDSAGGQTATAATSESAAGGTRTTINGTSGGGGQVADDGGLADAGRELQKAAKDLMAAARSMRRSGGGGGVTDLLTKERGISGLRPSFRGA